MCNGHEITVALDVARAQTLCPWASLSGVHPFVLGYKSSCADLGWFVHEGTWWLGYGRDCKAPPNGKPAPTPASFLQTGEGRGSSSCALLGCTVGAVQGAPQENPLPAL